MHRTQSLPCAKGGGPRAAARRDCAVKSHEFALVFSEIGTSYCDNPSVILCSKHKMTAPFAQGSLRRSRAREVINRLNNRHDCGGFCVCASVLTAVHKPSPLGKVAEHLRSRKRYSSTLPILHRVWQNGTALFRQPSGLPPSPEGKAFFGHLIAELLLRIRVL